MDHSNRTAFPRLLGEIMRRDWRENRLPITVITAVMFVAVIIMLSNDSAVKLARGVATGGVVAATFVYAHASFSTERGLRALHRTSRQAVSPFALIMAKYVSMYGMALFSVTFPGLLLGQWRLLLWTASAVLLLSTLFTMGWVLSEKPWAPHVPILFLILVMIGVNRTAWITAWIMPHATIASAAAAVLALILGAGSALIFARRQRA